MRTTGASEEGGRLMATTFSGRAHLRRRLRQLPAIARAQIRKGLEESATQVTNMQKNLVPVSRISHRHVRDTIGWHWGIGGARGSIGGTSDFGLQITAGDEEAWWARYIEFGTKPHRQGGIYKRGNVMHPGTRPHPYFFAAWRALKKSVKSRMRRSLKRAVALSKNA